MLSGSQSSPAETQVSGAWVKYSRSGFIHPGDEAMSFYERVGYIREDGRQREGYIQYKKSSHTWNSKTKQKKTKYQKASEYSVLRLNIPTFIPQLLFWKAFPQFSSHSCRPLRVVLSQDCLDLCFPKAKKCWFVLILFLCPCKTTLETHLFRESFMWVRYSFLF